MARCVFSAFLGLLFVLTVCSAQTRPREGRGEILEAAPSRTDIYPSDANAKLEIREALRRAAENHKRVLLVFGANWCYDCHVLDRALHEGSAGKIVEESFELVHVNIGEGDKNLDLVQTYKILLERGVPALVVLDGGGNSLYSSEAGEFEAARRMLKRRLVEFLRHWKGNEPHRG